MKPELELGISNLSDASFKSFRLYQKGFESHWHYHPEIELVFFTQGKGMRFIGDDISLYNEGDLFLIGENLPHTFKTYEEESTPFVEAFCIQFPKQIFESFLECKSLKSLFQEAQRGIYFKNMDEPFITKFKSIVSTNGISSIVLLLELLDSLLHSGEKTILLDKDYQQYILSDSSTRIQVAIDYINANGHRSISLQEISEECNFSPNAFCRWFKQNMGLTFVDYLNKVRLTQVCQLLISTDLSIGQIAIQMGFDNISTLNRLFQQKLHLSPSQYRTLLFQNP
jgi:AraC-like DNA-binding protein